MCDSKIVIKKRQKGLTRNELEKLSKTELIDKIIQLEAYNFQLKNILQKKLNAEDKKKEPTMVELMNAEKPNPNMEKRHEITEDRIRKKKRKFDFSRAHRRHVLLRLLYFGWDYQGFACQEDSNATIEHHLFGALLRACLIESRESSNYHRCGRTDKEVSAFCQVISIDLRSKFVAGEQLTLRALASEMDYCGLLNRMLPKTIQCIAWMPLKSQLYSARFDCRTRTYRYFFPKGNLNIDAMRIACRQLERHTDFRNFCKMDVHNGVTKYIREVRSANIHSCPNANETDDRGYSMYYLEIKANAFLWHQIRCIMAVLLLIGEGREEPNVINELLDVESNPCKPQYTPAIGLPLNLFECDFNERTQRRDNTDAAIATPAIEQETETLNSDHTTHWIYNEDTLRKLIETIQGEWTKANVKSTMIRNVLHNLELTLSAEFQSEQIRMQTLLLQDSIRPRQYQKLLTRKRCESLENRIEHFVKKQRLLVKPSVVSEM